MVCIGYRVDLVSKGEIMDKIYAVWYTFHEKGMANVEYIGASTAASAKLIAQAKFGREVKIVSVKLKHF